MRTRENDRDRCATVDAKRKEKKRKECNDQNQKLSCSVACKLKLLPLTSVPSMHSCHGKRIEFTTRLCWSIFYYPICPPWMPPRLIRADEFKLNRTRNTVKFVTGNTVRKEHWNTIFQPAFFLWSRVTAPMVGYFFQTVKRQIISCEW